MKSKLSVVAVSCAMLITATGNLGAHSAVSAPAAMQSNLGHVIGSASSKGMSTPTIITAAVAATEFEAAAAFVITTVQILKAITIPPPQAAPAGTAEVATLDQ